jgi:hypothetical protein
MKKFELILREHREFEERLWKLAQEIKDTAQEAQSKLRRYGIGVCGKPNAVGGVCRSACPCRYCAELLVTVSAVRFLDYRIAYGETRRPLVEAVEKDQVLSSEVKLGP